MGRTPSRDRGHVMDDSIVPDEEARYRAAVIAFLFEIGRHVGMSGSHCNRIAAASGVDRALVDEITIGARGPLPVETEEGHE
jgi:hypothetical protein